MRHRERGASLKNRAFLTLATFILCFTEWASLTLPSGSEPYSRHALCSFENCDVQLPAPQNLGPLRFIKVQAKVNQESTGNVGRWRLVRTLGPDGGDVVSIMHVADALKSDPDFAGLMIRCREKLALQIALVVIRPFPPRSHPQISISSGQMNVHFETSVVPPGSLLTLPNEAEVLAQGPWQSASQLSVEIESDGEKIRGIVPLENLSNAIAYLQANCSPQ